MSNILPFIIMAGSSIVCVCVCVCVVHCILYISFCDPLVCVV